MNEIWKPIRGYEGFYEVSSLGNVRSLKRATTNGKVLKQGRRPNEYLKVTLCKNNNHKTRAVHRLVAEAFIPNPNNLPEVNHKDGNKRNNSVENLEWVTREENVWHSMEVGLRKPIFNNPLRSKAVKQYSLDGILLHIYPSTGEAERQTGIRHGNIVKCCNRQTPTAGGYKWEYAEELRKLKVSDAD